MQCSPRILKFYRTWNCYFEFTYLRIGKYDECDYEYFATKLSYSYIFENNNSDIILYTYLLFENYLQFCPLFYSVFVFFSLFKIILQLIDNIVQPKQCAFFIILSNDIWWMCRKCDPHSISTIIRSTLNVYIPSKWVMQKNNIPTAWPIINIDTLCLDFEPHIQFVLPDMQLY